MFRPITFHSHSGGVGTSTVMHSLAILAAKRGLTVPLVNDRDTLKILAVAPFARSERGVDDIPGIAGLQLVAHPWQAWRATQCGELLMSSGEFRDDAQLLFVNANKRPITIGVVTNCYLNLSNTLDHGVRYDHLVYVRRPQRALLVQDVESALGRTVDAQVEWDPHVARAIDAGLLNMRLPHSLQYALEPLLHNLIDEAAVDAPDR